MFKPLTTGSGENTHGAKTIVTQTLKFKGSSAGNKTPLTGKNLFGVKKWISVQSTCIKNHH